MRRNLAWRIVGAPGPEHDRAVDLLDRLRQTNPPSLDDASVIAVIRQHLDADDDPSGDLLLATILAVESDRDAN